tara:strand:- start:482 stop:916 length:435 start_codon:yes stop_codon:yes gene_type:complete
MIKFTYNLLNYKPVKVLPGIKRVIKIDRQKLQDGIDEFQNELNWKEMWSVGCAEKRLDDGWYFNILEIDNKIVGWAWFNPKENELCNLYVNKEYRSKGYGSQLIYSIMNIIKNIGVSIICANVDKWNINSQRIFIGCNWKTQSI